MNIQKLDWKYKICENDYDQMDETRKSIVYTLTCDVNFCVVIYIRIQPFVNILVWMMIEATLDL